MRLDEAIDRFGGWQARKGRQPAGRDSYRRKLNLFADHVGGRRDVAGITPVECERFIDRWSDSKPSTLAHSISVLTVFFRWLWDEGEIDRSPMERIRRPPIPDPDDLDVTTVGETEVGRMLAVCESWTELLCLAVLLYLGPRRRAAAQLRWRDIDVLREEMTFREKGGKVIVKPLPGELGGLLRAAALSGQVPSGPADYVIPNLHPWKVRREERDPRAVWEIVRRVAGRAGVRSHAHALRGAFATRYLEQHPGDLEALQSLMGHRRLETTRVYLRRLDRRKAMERVRDLTWGDVFRAKAEEAHTGFEPVLPAEALSEPWRRKLAELDARQRERR